MGMTAEQYEPREGETVLKEGRLNHWRGEPGFANALSGGFKSTECNAVLTNQRFVCFKRNVKFPFGPLVWLVLWLMRRRKVFFGVELSDIKSVAAQGDAGGLFAVETANGKVTFQATAVFGQAKQRDEWVAALRGAVPAAASR